MRLNKNFVNLDQDIKLVNFRILVILFLKEPFFVSRLLACFPQERFSCRITSRALLDLTLNWGVVNLNPDLLVLKERKFLSSCY